MIVFTHLYRYTINNKGCINQLLNGIFQNTDTNILEPNRINCKSIYHIRKNKIWFKFRRYDSPTHIRTIIFTLCAPKDEYNMTFNIFHNINITNHLMPLLTRIFYSTRSRNIQMIDYHIQRRTNVLIDNMPVWRNRLIVQ
jgi:hypothetical protein